MCLHNKQIQKTGFINLLILLVQKNEKKKKKKHWLRKSYTNFFKKDKAFFIGLKLFKQLLKQNISKKETLMHL